MSTKKKILILFGVEVFLLFAIYMGVSIFYMFHFYTNTTLNGTEVSNCAADDVRDMWEKEVNGYALKIVERDGKTELIKGNDIDLKLQWDDSVKNLIRNQNGFAWVMSLKRVTPLESSTIVAYDEKRFDTVVSQLKCMQPENQIEPVDATYSEYSREDGFTVVPPVPGTVIDTEVFNDRIRENICGLQPQYVIADEGGYTQPKVSEDNPTLISIVEQMNELSKSSITFQMGDTEEILDGAVFKDWFVFSEDAKVSIDESKIDDYVAELEKKYNTFDSPKELETSYGKTVTIKNSHYGWKIDSEKEKAQIREDIKSGKAITRDLNYITTANSHGEHDYGDSYVEINLTAQHLYLYKDGKKIMDSPFVSGNIANGNGTPSGAYGITYCDLNATLNGQGYSTPVTYWMPFNGNIGMHDAYWRASFGGSVYRGGGSHGCINLPTESAKQIFAVVDKNYPVLVYTLEGTETKAVSYANNYEPNKYKKASDEDKKQDDKKDKDKKKNKKKKKKKKK